jgi:hypothetical protein
MSLQSIRSAIKAEYDYYHHPYCKLFVVCLLVTGDFFFSIKKKENEYLSNCENNIVIN